LIDHHLIINRQRNTNRLLTKTSYQIEQHLTEVSWTDDRRWQERHHRAIYQEKVSQNIEQAMRIDLNSTFKMKKIANKLKRSGDVLQTQLFKKVKFLAIVAN
jgi:hypothetical protein